MCAPPLCPVPAPRGGPWASRQPSTLICLPAVLQLFCSSPKAALRYAAVRTLNKVSSEWAEWGWGSLPAPALQEVQPWPASVLRQ